MMFWLLMSFSVAPPTAEPIPEIRLARSGTTSNPLLDWRLTYDEFEQINGNAAILWMRAGVVMRRINQNWEQVHFGVVRQPISPKDQKIIQDILEKHATAYKYASEAARCTYCDWQRPAVTIQNLADGSAIEFVEVQPARELAHLLRLRANLALAERRWDDARRDLRIGLTLARHLADGQTVLSDLVAIAVTSALLDVVDHWVTLPDSPNLYWALTELPAPFIDARRSIRHELNTIYRSVPGLRDLTTRNFSDKEILNMWKQISRQSKSSDLTEVMDVMISTATMHLKYPTAHKALLARGYPESRLKTMSKSQVVLLWMQQEYNQEREPILQMLCLPTHPGLSRLEEWAKEHKKRVEKSENVLVKLQGLSTLSFVKTWQAQARLERAFVALRAVELLRGRDTLPEKWAELNSELLDPLTGKPLDAWYRREDKQAVLHLPSPFRSMQKKFLLMARPAAKETLP